MTNKKKGEKVKTRRHILLGHPLGNKTFDMDGRVGVERGLGMWVKNAGETRSFNSGRSRIEQRRENTCQFPNTGVWLAAVSASAYCTSKQISIYLHCDTRRQRP